MTLFLFLLACAADENTTAECVTVITVSTDYTVQNDGSIRNERCFEVNSDGDIDYDLCCPEDFVPLAMSAAGLLCELD